MKIRCPFCGHIFEAKIGTYNLFLASVRCPKCGEVFLVNNSGRIIKQRLIFDVA